MGKTCCGCAVKDNYRSTFIRTFIANPLRSMQVKAVVLAAFTAITIAGIYGCTQIQVQGDVNDFIPAGSYLLDYFRDQENMFDRVGEQVRGSMSGGYKAAARCVRRHHTDIAFAAHVVQTDSSSIRNRFPFPVGLWQIVNQVRRG